MSLARHQTSPRSDSRPAGFDFTLHMRRLCDDVVARLDQLGHIEMSRVAISFSQTRKATHHGMFASLTPMRFAGGRPHRIRWGQKWAVQRLHGPDGGEMLYILNFYLPRFLNLQFREKLTTVIHELWHIGPKFDGDVRRYGGRCFGTVGPKSSTTPRSSNLSIAGWRLGRRRRSWRFFVATSVTWSPAMAVSTGARSPRRSCFRWGRWQVGSGPISIDTPCRGG